MRRQIRPNAIDIECLLHISRGCFCDICEHWPREASIADQHIQTAKFVVDFVGEVFHAAVRTGVAGYDVHFNGAVDLGYLLRNVFDGACRSCRYGDTARTGSSVCIGDGFADAPASTNDTNDIGRWKFDFGGICGAIVGGMSDFGEIVDGSSIVIRHWIRYLLSCLTQSSNIQKVPGEMGSML